VTSNVMRDLYGGLASPTFPYPRVPAGSRE